MAGWGTFNCASGVYDLSHLDPFVMGVTPKAVGAPTFRVLVSFGHHAFTREILMGDAPDMHFAHNGDARCFCLLRHGHSQNLPNILRGASGRKAFFSQNHNYLLVEQIAGLAGPYAVFFNIQQATGKNIDARLFVVSAYSKPNLPPRLPGVPFVALVANVSKGLPVTKPKK